jgi:hypothetical protein
MRIDLLHPRITLPPIAAPGGVRPVHPTRSAKPISVADSILTFCNLVAICIDKAALPAAL